MRKHKLNETVNNLNEWTVTNDCDRVMFITDVGEMVTCTDWDCGYRGTDHSAFITNDYDHLIYIDPETHGIIMECVPTDEQQKTVLELVKMWDANGYITDVNTTDNMDYGECVNKLMECGLPAVDALKQLFDKNITLVSFDDIETLEYTDYEKGELFYCDEFAFSVD